MTAVNGYEVALNRATITAFLAVYDGDVARFAGDDYATRCQDVARAAARLVIEPAEGGGVSVPPAALIRFLKVYHRNDDRFGRRELQIYAARLALALPMLAGRVDGAAGTIS